MSMGMRIKESRKKLGITQVALAEKIGLTQSNITDYERERVSPSIETLLKLSKVLNVSLDWLASGQEIRSEIINKLDKDIMQTAIEIAEKFTDGYIVPPEDKAEYIIHLYNDLLEKKHTIQKTSKAAS